VDVVRDGDENVMTQRRDIEFLAEGDVVLRGWLFLPDEVGPHPAITMAHGFAGVKEHGLERFARVFADAGFVVLVHDHRGFGASDGTPRYDIDPWIQIADWRRAISFLEAQPSVDPERIGLWGSSYAGGHAIVLGATDRRLRAVVAQVPTVRGYEQSLRRVAPDQQKALEASFIERRTTPVSRRVARHPGGGQLRSRDTRRVPVTRRRGVL
jgi:hypothetical protein